MTTNVKVLQMPLVVVPMTYVVVGAGGAAVQEGDGRGREMPVDFTDVEQQRQVHPPLRFASLPSRLDPGKDISSSSRISCTSMYTLISLVSGENHSRVRRRSLSSMVCELLKNTGIVSPRRRTRSAVFTATLEGGRGSGEEEEIEDHAVLQHMAITEQLPLVFGRRNGFRGFLRSNLVCSVGYDNLEPRGYFDPAGIADRLVAICDQFEEELVQPAMAEVKLQRNPVSSFISIFFRNMCIM